jgi:hypothetical protein
MYTKLELILIFTSARNLEELNKICDVFNWLIDEQFESKSDFLHKVSQLAFRKITNI